MYMDITDLKDMLKKSGELYGDRPAYKLKIADSEYKIYTHGEVRDMIDSLGTALINLGLKDKRIAIIGENRFEWELAYLAVVCGTGIVVPFDKSLPANELESLIERSNVDAIFYTAKHAEIIEKIKYSGKNNLKHLISMDNLEHGDGIYSQKELIEIGKKLLENGNREFIDAKINAEEMSVMLFTSGTTSKSKVVYLSHRNICSNVMQMAKALDMTTNDTLLSVLPLHHAFECTVGFLVPIYCGAQITFSDGLRHIAENLQEYKITFMACVPGVYERLFTIMMKSLEKDGKITEILENEEKYKNSSMEVKRDVFKEIHRIFGGNIRMFMSGAAALDRQIEERYRNFGVNIVQGYGLTETSPVIAVGTNTEYKLGSIGKALEGLEVKLANVNSEGVGELIVKGPTVMLGYGEDIEATNEVIKDGWFYTGDLATIDDEGYIFICGRKKSVIVLKNGKNIFPEEMESLINKIEGVKESFVFGKKISDDKDNIKINVKIVFDREKMNEVYKISTDEDIYKAFQNEVKEINKKMPTYKAIRGLIITEEPLIRTTTNKIKRQDNLDAIEKFEY